MPTYKFTLGNVSERPGHRHDCAQVRIEIEIDADDAQQALARLHRACDELRVTLPRGLGRVVCWQLNLDRVSVKDAKVQK